MNCKLVVIAGLATKSSIPLKLPTIIGRSPEADLTVNHPSVSRLHCEITAKDGVLVVRDNGSANGTHIEGERIKGRSILRMGDTLKVGPLTFAAIYKHAGDYPVLQ
ncbi:MAG: FHA domain-containing protein [Planctomycetales bacterium]